MGRRAKPLYFVCLGCGELGETYSASHKGVFHDKACRANYERKGRDEPSRYKQAGYWMLRWNEGGRYVYQFEHRRVWEDAYGPIPDGYSVHHINENKRDNRLENLQLMRVSDHISHHTAQPDIYPGGGTSAEYTRRWRERHPEYRAIHARQERERRARLRAARKMA